MSKKIDRMLLARFGLGKAKSLEIHKAFPMGSLATLVGNDVKDQLGHPVQGIAIKDADAKKIMLEAKKALDEDKIANLSLTIGVSGKDVILLAKGGPTWEKFALLVAGYTDILDKQKQTPEGVVVNLDEGNDVIDKASANMAKKFNTTAITEPEELSKKLGGLRSGELVLLAHGDEDKTSSGQIYGKDFAGTSAGDLVTFLTKHKDVNKRLHPDFNGTIYLDGCFTAQGGAMKNYAMDVWNRLKKAGIPNVKVKGNLGLASTTDEGDEIVSPSQELAEYKQKIDSLYKQATAIVEICDKRLEQIKEESKKKKVKAEDQPEYKVLWDKRQQAVKKHNETRQDIINKSPVNIKNLVGKFGLELVN